MRVGGAGEWLGRKNEKDTIFSTLGVRPPGFPCDGHYFRG
jgi:hypothetical protein